MEEIRRTKGKVLNRDQIKYIAVILMALNHIANIFLKEGTVPFLLLRNLGYFTAPVMCFFLVEGYYYTHSRKQYGQRLLLFALLSQIPFQIAFGEGQSWRLVRGNMILTLFICFLILVCLDERHVLPAAVLIFLTAFCDWGMATPLMVILFRNSRMKQKKRIWWTFNLWEADAFQQYLEEMALQGWFLENVGSSVMKLYRAQPEKR